jgi:periplasmic divalent cation tolerance protein
MSGTLDGNRPGNNPAFDGGVAVLPGAGRPCFSVEVKATRIHWVVFSTAPDEEAARKVARAAVEKGLAACAQMLPGLESHYRWKGRLEQGREVKLIFKTTRARLAELEALVHSMHPYETPEWVAWPLAAGSDAYLRWITASVAADAKTPTARRPAGRRPRARSRR